MIAFLETTNSIAATVLAECLNTFPITAAIAIAVWAILKFARGLNASSRHAIWWAALGAILLVAPLRIAFQNPTAAQPIPAAPTPATAASYQPVAIAPAAAPEFQSAAPDEPQRPIDPGWIPLALALGAAIWLGLQGARILYSYVHVKGLKSSGIKPPADLQVNFDEWVLSSRIGRPARLLLSDRISSPVAAGFRQPAVLIPATLVGRLSSSDLDHMLLHELAHLARRDDWTNLAVRVAWSIVGLHPVAAFILRRIDEERELACDDWVVETTGAARPYAVSLSRLVEYRLLRSREMLATGIGGRRSNVADRIERLLKARCRFDSRLSVTRIGATIAVLLAALAGGLQVPGWIAFAQSDPPPTPPPVVHPAAPEQPPPPPVPARPPAPAKVERAKVPPPVPAAAPEIAPVPQPPIPAALASPAPVPRPAIASAAAKAAPVPAPPAAGASPALAPQPPAPPRPLQPEQEPPSFLKAVAEAGFSDLPVDAIIEMRNNGVSADYLKSIQDAAAGRLTVSEIIELRRSGVSPEYLKTCRQAGMTSLNTAGVITLQRFGVSAEGVREIHSLGFGPYEPAQLIEFWNSGIRPDYFRTLKSAGFGNLDPKSIIDARRHGVSGANLSEARKYGPNLTMQQIIRLKQAGAL